jgi:flagellar biosynthesis chaperone FliJ
MKSVLFLFLWIFSSCSLSDKNAQKQHVFYEHQINQYKDSLINLKIELENSVSYIETAEVHQVTRTTEERERQLKNLIDYKAELEYKIKSVGSIMDSYSDSLSLLQSNQK